MLIFGTKNPIFLVPILGLIFGTPFWVPPFILFRWSPFWVPKMGPKTGTRKMAKNAPRNAKIGKKNAARRKKKTGPGSGRNRLEMGPDTRRHVTSAERSTCVSEACLTSDLKSQVVNHSPI